MVGGCTSPGPEERRESNYGRDKRGVRPMKSIVVVRPEIGRRSKAKVSLLQSAELMACNRRAKYKMVSLRTVWL